MEVDFPVSVLQTLENNVRIYDTFLRTRLSYITQVEDTAYQALVLANYREIIYALNDLPRSYPSLNFDNEFSYMQKYVLDSVSVFVMRYFMFTYARNITRYPELTVEPLPNRFYELSTSNDIVAKNKVTLLKVMQWWAQLMKEYILLVPESEAYEDRERSYDDRLKSFKEDCIFYCQHFVDGDESLNVDLARVYIELLTVCLRNVNAIFRYVTVVNGIGRMKHSSCMKCLGSVYCI